MPPLNLVGDFGGGGMLLAFGIGVRHCSRRSASGTGQVVDAAMVDGAAVLMTMFHAFRAMGIWEDERGTNMLDTGAHFYDVYETADGEYVSIGSIEPQFYAELLRLTGLEGEDAARGSTTRPQWPDAQGPAGRVFRPKTRDEWCELMEGTDVCFAPGARRWPRRRSTPTTSHRGHVRRGAPASCSPPRPRASAARPGEVQRPPAHAGQHTDEVLDGAGASTPPTCRSCADAGAIA